jgi:hypothetical protein
LNHLYRREFLIWKERGRGRRERGAGRRLGRFKVRLGLGEIEGSDRDTERYRDIETKRQS